MTRLLKTLSDLNAMSMRPYQLFFDWQLDRKLKKLSEKEAGLVLALLIDMRNKAISDANCDIFESISSFRTQLNQNRKEALQIWPYIRRDGSNRFLDIASRIFMGLTQSRDERLSRVWSQLTKSVDLVPECARDWEQKHNELLRIYDYKKVPTGIVLENAYPA
ncbi:hypothetical protein ACFOOP_10480 [Marinicaulis aureus]|uniref:Uncharacterized protein n=1 Tax=Hyphococcus aureus TaxID=2666033 RepID=A0ABW1L063_9PROT